ncbi:MAG: hypothetical protein JXA20_08010 [Spirochaetes bacterium]|nr:hypothetical protein [Spirochaetota bacterium]
MMRVVPIACAYGAAILAAELILGSAGSPLHLWHFERISPWQWSLPVHAAGFLWILAWTRLLRHRPAAVSMIASWAFFAVAETCNRFLLVLFEYGGAILGGGASLAAVLVLYALLCGAAVYALRRWASPPRAG